MKKTPPQIPALDGLRGVAATLVVLFHFGGIVLVNFFGEDQRPLGALFGFGAWLGVALFFILSSFLIIQILVQARRQTFYFRDFYCPNFAFAPGSLAHLSVDVLFEARLIGLYWT